MHLVMQNGRMRDAGTKDGPQECPPAMVIMLSAFLNPGPVGMLASLQDVAHFVT